MIDGWIDADVEYSDLSWPIEYMCRNWSVSYKYVHVTDEIKFVIVKITCK